MLQWHNRNKGRNGSWISRNTGMDSLLLVHLDFSQGCDQMTSYRWPQQDPLGRSSSSTCLLWWPSPGPEDRRVRPLEKVLDGAGLPPAGQREENGSLFQMCFFVPVSAKCWRRLPSGTGTLSSSLKIQVCCY